MVEVVLPTRAVEVVDEYDVVEVVDTDERDEENVEDDEPGVLRGDDDITTCEPEDDVVLEKSAEMKG